MLNYFDIQAIIYNHSPKEASDILKAYKDLFATITQCSTGILYRTKDNTRVMVHKSNDIIEVN